MQLKTIYATSGETLKVTNQWAAECEKRGTSISSSTWELSDGSSVSDSLSGTEATATITPTSCGCLKNTVTLANGEVLIAERLVKS